MSFRLSAHALDEMQKRRIPADALEQTMSVPDQTDSDTVISRLREAGVAVARDYRNGVFDALLSPDADLAHSEAKRCSCLYS